MKRFLLLFLLLFMASSFCAAGEDGARRAARLPAYYWDLSSNDDSQRGGLLGTFTNADDTNRLFVDAATGVYAVAAANQPRNGCVNLTDSTRALLVEPGATNRALWSRDLSNGAWVPTNCTGTKDQVGLDGVANSASSLLATGANCTALQTVTIASAFRTYSVYIKRITGTGTVWLTDNNDANRTECTSLSSTQYTRYQITREQANPVFGIKMLTSGDKIAVDCNQLEDSKFSTNPIHTTTTAISRTTEAGFPTWSLPSDVFAESLGSEIATGTLTAGNTYKITADTGNDFYAGSAVGEYFISAGTETCDADSKVKQVLNPSSEGGPPRGTVVLWWRPGHGDGDIPSGVDYSGIFSTRDSTLSLIRYDDTNNRFQAYDSANSAYFPTFTAVRDTWYKLVLQFGYLTSNVGKMRLGLDGGSGVSYSTASNYDGAFDVTGSLLRVGYGATAPFHIRAIAIYPDKILTDTFINAGGSP